MLSLYCVHVYLYVHTHSCVHTWYVHIAPVYPRFPANLNHLRFSLCPWISQTNCQKDECAKCLAAFTRSAENRLFCYRTILRRPWLSVPNVSQAFQWNTELDLSWLIVNSQQFRLMRSVRLIRSSAGCKPESHPNYMTALLLAIGIKYHNIWCSWEACAISCCTLVAVRPANINPSEGQQLCVVCNDVANGVHFGAITCEGCKVGAVFADLTFAPRKHPDL